MARDDAWEVLDQAVTDMNNMSMREFIQARGIMAPFLAVTLVLVSGIMSVGEAVMRPARAIAGGLADVVSATFGESVLIISAGARQAAWSIEHGAASLFGPLAFPIAIATVMLGLYVLAYAWNRISWNPAAWLLNRF